MLKNMAFNVLCRTKIPTPNVSTSVRSSNLTGNHVFPEIIPSFLPLSVRTFSVSSLLWRDNAKRDNVDRSKLDMGTQGEHSVSVDYLEKLSDSAESVFPDEQTPERVFGGIRFADLPILSVKVTKNNTKMTVTDAEGNKLLYQSPRMIGFKNASKKTSLAAQATGVALGKAMMDKGVQTVRVQVGGLGPGRISCLKGVTISGVNIVSVSDVTDIDYYGNWRAKKPRRV